MGSRKTSFKTSKLKFSNCQAVVMIYMLVMFIMFPFFLTNYYGNARRDKFWFFVVVTSVAAVILLLLLLFNFIKSKMHNKASELRQIAPFSISVSDIGIISFFIATLISAFLASLSGGDFNAYFIGSNGRNMGVLAILMMLLAYFMISRFFYCRKYVFLFVMFAMAIMSYIAIVNFYYFDPLNIFAQYKKSESVILNFTSTIGNKNYLSAMICVALPFSIGLSLATNDKLTRILSYVSVAIQFMALIVATSDGGFLGCFIAIAVIFIVVCKDFKKLSKLFICLAVMTTASKLLWVFDLIMKGNNKGYTSFSKLFIYNNYLFALIPVFVGLAILCAKVKQNEKLSGVIFKCVISVAVVAVLASVFFFVYYSVIDTTSKLDGFLSFFRFDEDWGTHRGFFWIKSFEAFSKFDIREIMFGVGPDSFGDAFSQYYGELYSKYGETSTNAAHNVYIQYLITTGVFGLLTYLIFVGGVLYDAIRYAKQSPLGLLSMGVIVAYIAQDFVNIANPVNTPWFIIFVGLSQASLLKANAPERCKETL